MTVVASTVAELMAERGLPVAEKDLAAALDEALLARTVPRGVGALRRASAGVPRRPRRH